MSDLKDCKTCKHDGNQMIHIGPCTGCGGHEEYLNWVEISDSKYAKEQALCAIVKEFDNPLEALGIVMRETKARFCHYRECELELTLNDKHVLWEDLSIGHEDILNTLKGGKPDV